MHNAASHAAAVQITLCSARLHVAEIPEFRFQPTIDQYISYKCSQF